MGPPETIPRLRYTCERHRMSPSTFQRTAYAVIDESNVRMSALTADRCQCTAYVMIDESNVNMSALTADRCQCTTYAMIDESDA